MCWPTCCDGASISVVRTLVCLSTLSSLVIESSKSLAAKSSFSIWKASSTP